MNKEKILSEIKRTAAENKGKPLGIDRFHEETGIKKNDWYGKYWVKWSDALIEAGLQPNKFGVKGIDINLTLEKISIFTKELGHIPTKPEIKLKRRTDKSLPNEVSIANQIGNKYTLVTKLKEYCTENNSHEDVIEICDEYLKNNMPISKGLDHEDLSPDEKIEPGHVYLLKHDKVYKIGRSIDATRRYNEIRVQMPMKLEEIHVIETDDVVGIEAYWHKRFLKKRLEGEWFALNQSDIKAFKKRKFM